jgi:predicted nucleotidyltransferase
MRLTDTERRALLDVIAASDPDARVWLHGSRTRDDARGGDIDLLVLSQSMHLPEKLDVLTRLRQTLGDRRVDLTIALDASWPFVRLALAQGLRLG